MLTEARAVLGDRRAAVARELTKLHEEVLRGRLSELLDRIGQEPMKGEVVVVIAGADPAAEDLKALVGEARALVADGARTRDAARLVAERHDTSANRIYRRLLDPDGEGSG
jgi:16S rRNA (cytidine1402-2'-O)-methyltransferase